MKHLDASPDASFALHEIVYRQAKSVSLTLRRAKDASLCAGYAAGCFLGGAGFAMQKTAEAWTPTVYGSPEER
ncbi:MAG: hypothetical protein AAF483_07995 [Planctomycetota bacterium]